MRSKTLTKHSFAHRCAHTCLAKRFILTEVTMDALEHVMCSSHVASSRMFFSNLSEKPRMQDQVETMLSDESLGSRAVCSPRARPCHIAQTINKMAVTWTVKTSTSRQPRP